MLQRRQPSSPTALSVMAPADRPVSTLVEVLRRRATAQADKLAYRFLVDGENEGASITYAELDRRARAVGALLAAQGAAGERALLLYPSGLEFIVSFLGCLYAGAVAVPVHPPRANRPASRLAAIVDDAAPRFVLTAAALARLEPQLAAQIPGLEKARWIQTEGLAADWAERWTPRRRPGTTAAAIPWRSSSTPRARPPLPRA